jgi:predicted membrane protein
MIITPKISKWTWGLLFLLAAALIIANQVVGFVELGVFTIIIGVVCLAIIVQSIVNLSFSVLPLPLAALYFVFQDPLSLPDIGFGILLASAILATIGLSVLLPSKVKRKTGYEKRYKNRYTKEFADDYEYDYEEDGETITQVVSDDKERNFDINVQFGGISRYLRSDCLETVNLNCKFGGVDIYFDEVTLSPQGGKVHINCNFGGVELYVPREWRVSDHVSATLGGVDISGRRRHQPAPDAPELTLTGNVAFGNVEVHFT